jgi:hypothetical protein
MTIFEKKTERTISGRAGGGVSDDEIPALQFHLQ